MNTQEVNMPIRISKLILAILCVVSIGCASSPATVNKLEDGDLRATWGGYEIDVPKDAVNFHGFEVVATPSGDDHGDTGADATVLVENEWVDSVMETPYDYDIFVFQGKPQHDV